MSGKGKAIEEEGNRAEREKPLLDVLLKGRGLSRNSLIAGILGTIFFHLIGLFGLPSDVFTVEKTDYKDRFREFEVELAMAEEEPEQVYTQTNPDAPENEPDQTNNFAARSQQAAQEEAPEEIDDENRPSSESDDDIETNQFITGDLTPPDFAPPPSRQSEAQEEQEEAQDVPLLIPQFESQPLIKSIPIPGTQEEEDPDDTGILEVEYDEAEAPTNVNEYIKGEAEEGEEEEQVAASPQPFLIPQNAQVTAEASEPSPRPRPRLPKVAPGPVRNRDPGVSRTGTIAMDAKFSEFGEYMERFIEVVSVRWNSLADEAAGKENNSKVVLRFTLDKNGYISNLDTRPGSTSKVIGIYISRTALENGAPYGPWTAEMVEVFGDSEEVTFSFHYR
ncbi:MAG: hypothetical protein OSB19_02995 [Opitutaceae bacterium]|nr:hypothetical protein [Opitutaceae bacterium]